MFLHRLNLFHFSDNVGNPRINGLSSQVSIHSETTKERRKHGYALTLTHSW